jgi:hypothetical protein
MLKNCFVGLAKRVYRLIHALREGVKLALQQRDPLPARSLPRTRNKCLRSGILCHPDLPVQICVFRVSLPHSSH